jgi:hypothetical protein
MAKFVISPFTINGVPATGLTPTIRIRRVDTNAIVTTGSMSEVGDGWYKFEFKQYSGTLPYAMRIDGGASVPDGERYVWTGNDSFVEDVFDHPPEFHTGTLIPSGTTEETRTFGEMTTFVYEIEGGRWRIDRSTNEMIFFKNDNSTEIARFNLFDDTGTPASDDVFERIRTGSVV